MKLFSPSRKPRSAERGYILIILILFVALLAIGLMAMAPYMAQQMKRDREEELIHRGTQYSRAIKHYMKQFNQYPTRIENLENTNNIRYLRKRYKDPVTGKEFKLLHQGEVQMSSGIGLAGATSASTLAAGAAALGGGGAPTPFGGSGVFGGNSGSTLGGNNGSAFGGNSGSSFGSGGSSFGGNSGGAFGGNNQSSFGGNSSGAFGGNNSGSAFGGNNSGSAFSAFGGSQNQTPNPDGSNQPGTPGAPDGQGGFGQPVQNLPGTGSSQGAGGQIIGGGPIVGVASISKDKTIRIFNKKDHYKDWQFIYDPSADRGGLITTPYQPPSQIGGQNLNGTPSASGTQGAPGAPASPFGFGGGQQNSGFGGQQNSTFGGGQQGFGGGGNQPPQSPQPNQAPQ
jgi:type II secretory pathway pseudopilin PulG